MEEAMISNLHKWCFAAALWLLVLWITPLGFWRSVGIGLFAVAVLLLLRLGVGAFFFWWEEKYGD